MKLKQSVNLLMIALFVWAFQSTAIHFHDHEIDEISECNFCETSEKMDMYHHNTPATVVNENLAVKSRKSVEKIVLKSRFDYIDVPKPERVNIVEHQQYSVKPIPLGFNATAPPKNS